MTTFPCRKGFRFGISSYKSREIGIETGADRAEIVAKRTDCPRQLSIMDLYPTLLTISTWKKQKKTLTVFSLSLYISITRDLVCRIRMNIPIYNSHIIYVCMFPETRMYSSYEKIINFLLKVIRKMSPKHVSYSEIKIKCLNDVHTYILYDMTNACT